MAQTALAPLRSFLEIVWKALTVFPRRRLIYAQIPGGSTGFHTVGRFLGSPRYRHADLGH